MTLGNPAPLGLLAFGMTTAMLMYVDMGWVESNFQFLLYGTALYLGGVCQLLVAILELFKGSSFSFAVFGVYGAFWLGWAAVFAERASETSSFNDAIYPRGKAAFYATWGVLTACFFVITLRKNICLIVIFCLLTITFFLLAAAADTGSEVLQNVAGYFGFMTAIGAFYTGIAELINEEWGRHVLPGLKSRYNPERFVITKATISDLITYDRKTNTLLLRFRGLQIKSRVDATAIQEGVENKIKLVNPPNQKVHAIMDYKDAAIADELVDEYWEMVAGIQRDHYLSARRFDVGAFGTHHQEVVNGMTNVASVARL